MSTFISAPFTYWKFLFICKDLWRSARAASKHIWYRELFASVWRDCALVLANLLFNLKTAKAKRCPIFWNVPLESYSPGLETASSELVSDMNDVSFLFGTVWSLRRDCSQPRLRWFSPQHCWPKWVLQLKKETFNTSSAAGWSWRDKYGIYCWQFSLLIPSL